MRNAIKYYYGIDVDSLIYKNQSYFFNSYMLKELQRDIDISLYNFFISNHIYIHNIIPNNQGSYVTIIDGKRYALFNMKHNVKISIEEINNFFVNLIVEEKKDWGKLWENKVDYYEKKIIEIKDKEYLDVFPYYIGLSEIAIRLYKEAGTNGTYGICHNRLINDEEFYSPDNIIIDYKVRDIAEYIKILFFRDKLEIENIVEQLNKIYLSNTDYMLLFARLFFPTYFFDCLENNGNINVYISRINQYEQFLSYIYCYLKEKAYIPKIDWLKKQCS